MPTQAKVIVADQLSKTVKFKPTAEQISIAHITELKNGPQDPTSEKVSQLMEMTARSEEDSCLALYECDNDLERAIVYLLENLEVGALNTITKKKKTKIIPVPDVVEEKPKIRHQQDRAMMNRSAPRRGGFSGARGGRGGRMGTRGGREQFKRDENFRNNNKQQQQEIDDWDSVSTQANVDVDKKEASWGDLGDWDNEEYSGSLTDTKVFMSTAANPVTDALPGPLQNQPTRSEEFQSHDLPQSVPLSAEQSQFLTTLGLQNSFSSAVQFPAWENQQQKQQRARARVPPPSKIPVSAVEMPSDGLSEYLGLSVQFGELDFGSVGNGVGKSKKADKNEDKSNSEVVEVSKGLESLNESFKLSTQADLALNFNQQNIEETCEKLLKTIEKSTHQNLLDSSTQKSYQSVNNNQSSNIYPPSSNYKSYNQNSYINQQTQTSTTSSKQSNQLPVNHPGLSWQQQQSVFSSNIAVSSSASSVSSSATNSFPTQSSGFANNSTKTATKAAATNTTMNVNGANNVAQNVPLVSSYIQPAAYYQQQPYMHYDEIQLMQPHMTPVTSYFDYSSPPPPTTLGAAIRSDGTSAMNLASVASTTMAPDSRNNSSPVQSQQQQLPYAYYYGANMMPNGYQQFPPPIYSQMHSNPNVGQFAKQSAYNSGYNSSGYNQAAPNYNKNFPSVNQQSKPINQTATNSNIANSNYKSQMPSNAANLYDKQTFHSSATLPATQTTSQNQNQAYQQHLYLQPMTTQHNMNMHQQPIHPDLYNSNQRQQSKAGSKPIY
jgi:NACalpha-BTF3-like transcription factor